MRDLFIQWANHAENNISWGKRTVFCARQNNCLMEFSLGHLAKSPDECSDPCLLDFVKLHLLVPSRRFLEEGPPPLHPVSTCSCSFSPVSVSSVGRCPKKRVTCTRTCQEVFVDHSLFPWVSNHLFRSCQVKKRTFLTGRPPGLVTVPNTRTQTDVPKPKERTRPGADVVQQLSRGVGQASLLT